MSQLIEMSALETRDLETYQVYDLLDGVYQVLTYSGPRAISRVPDTIMSIGSV